MALAGAKLFVEEGAHVFLQARRQEALDDAVKLIGRNVTAVQGDAAELDDLDRLTTPSSGRRARSTCCGPAPGWANRPSSAISPMNSSTAPSGSTRAARCSPCRRHCR